MRARKERKEVTPPYTPPSPSSLKNSPFLILSLCFTLMVGVGEGVMMYTSSCVWYDEAGTEIPILRLGQGHQYENTQCTIGIIADPQLTDSYSYNQSPGILLWLTQFYSDLYMRRAYKQSVLSHNPKAVVFLGDLLDGGRVATEEQFSEGMDRFHKIFVNALKVPYIYVVGNHDVGLGKYHSCAASERWETVFGQRNMVYEVCGLKIGVVNAIAMTHKEFKPFSSPSSTSTKPLGGSTKTINTHNHPTTSTHPHNTCQHRQALETSTFLSLLHTSPP